MYVGHVYALYLELNSVLFWTSITAANANFEYIPSITTLKHPQIGNYQQKACNPVIALPRIKAFGVLVTKSMGSIEWRWSTDHGYRSVLHKSGSQTDWKRVVQYRTRQIQRFRQTLLAV